MHMTLRIFKKKNSLSSSLLFLNFFIEYKYYRWILNVIPRNVNRFSRHSRCISAEMPTSSLFKRGNIDIRGGFWVSSPALPIGCPLPVLVKQTGTSGVSGVHRDVRSRRKLGRNRSAGVPRQDVVNAATLTRTEDDYRAWSFFTVMSGLMMQMGHAERFLKMPIVCYAIGILSVPYLIFTRHRYILV